MHDEKSRGLETIAVHAGFSAEDRERFYGAVTLPIFQTSTYISTGREDYIDIRYMRLNNSPNHVALNRKLAALEGAEDAMAMASGMAAIATTLLSVLKSGDHILAQNCLYGGTYSLFLDDAEDLGWKYDFIDAHDPASWERARRPETKAIYVEAITNPLVRVGELAAAVAFAKKHGLISIIDSTFASPYNFNPLALGFDLVVHSGTKYMNGHSDLIAGCVAGSREWIRKINKKLIHFGGMLDTHSCFLLDRGLKTFPIRMRQHNQNTLELARFLEGHPRVERVYYPGLASHPDHKRARELMRGFGGVLSFELKSDAATTEALLKQLKLAAFAPSLGGVETLVTMPALTSHKSLTSAQRQGMGISDKVVRVAVGLETSADLIADFTMAFGA